MDINLVSPSEAHYTVYKLTDPEGKIYIGMTGKPVESRWRKGHNYNQHSAIKKAIVRIGWENFKKEILCEKLTREGAEKMEEWFVVYYDSMDPEKGYNRFTGGAKLGCRASAAAIELNRESKLEMFAGNPELCRRYSEGTLAYYRAHPEAKSRIALQVSEYLHTPEGRKFAECDSRPKPVRCVETGKIYPSQCAAERETGFCNIHKACSGRHSSCGGYHWEYV